MEYIRGKRSFTSEWVKVLYRKYYDNEMEEKLVENVDFHSLFVLFGIKLNLP